MTLAARMLGHELRMQQLLFWRNKESAVFVFVFPPMLFLLLGAVYDGTIDGVPAADRLLVGMLGYGCANTAFGGLAITLVIRREAGLLKRVRATPLPPATSTSCRWAATTPPRSRWSRTLRATKSPPRNLSLP